MPNDHPFHGLMDELRRGEPDAAREVFDRFARRLVGLAASRLPGFVRASTDPEDVAQSVLRTFFRRHGAGEFRPEHWDALWALLAVLTVRKCGHKVEHLLAARRDVRREVRPGGPSAGSAPSWEPADRAPTPEEAVLLEETLDRVLAGLTERERPVVLLRLQGHEVAEIARQIPCSERTVHRVLAGVRDRLEALSAD
ncbi:MAG: RNA polymerase subunit sigma-24 [Planctomycetes bacterium]|nr:RNA polymerase subunit sigma-24 [Planctomycetota bacterium]